MYVKCYCNGENCKINIAVGIFSLHWKSAHLLATGVVSVFALQLLNIVVYTFPKMILAWLYGRAIFIYGNV